MADLYRLILAVLLLCFGPAALADGGPFPATPGQWGTASCNASNYTGQAPASGGTKAWECKAASGTRRSCGWSFSAPQYGSNYYFEDSCTQDKGPDTCPAGGTLGTGGDGASTCTCGPGLIPFNGTCTAKPQCDPGFHEEGGACVPDKCKPDETRVGTACIKDPPCPPGSTRVGKECKPNKCKAGASAGDYTDLSDSVTYLCEMSNGLNCQVRVKPTICVRFDGQESCSGAGVFTGATCSGGNGGTGGGTGNGDGGTGDPGTGGTGTGGTGTGGTGTGGTGTGGTGTGGTGTGGTGTGGTGTGGTGTGGTGTGGTGTGGTGTGDTGTGGTGTGGTGTGTGTDSGTGTPNLPPPKPTPPAQDGTCPSGMHKSGTWCINDPATPDDDGKCPDGTVKINAKCYSTEPGGGGTGSGDGDGEGDKSGFGGSCMSGFACDGDAIQCAIAKEQYRRNCQLFEDKSAESELYEAEKKKDRNRDVTKDLPGNEEIDVSSKLSRLNVLGAAACIGDLSVTVWHTQVTLPFSRLCPSLEQLGWILVVVSSIAAARIVTKT